VSHTIRIDPEVRSRLLVIKHQLEAASGRVVSFSQVVAELLRRSKT
jgi:predicted CopG family antitoxin